MPTTTARQRDEHSDLADERIERSLLAAPIDDEPETSEEKAAVEEALRDIREGRTVSHEEVKRRLGLG
jgi:predicted transcriptional regulator